MRCSLVSLAMLVLGCTPPATVDTSVACVATEEICNGADEDCDGLIDEDAVDAPTWYADGDGDGSGDDATADVRCDADPGDVREGGDCDDADAAVSPTASEDCDGFDQDCDGVVDNGLPVQTWYVDADGDLWGAAEFEACAGDGYVATGGDCDDADPLVNPSVVEACDGRDEDCDDVVDDGASDAPTWYTDADGDTFGDAESPVVACTPADGQVADATDCDDGEPGANPAELEVCGDEIDNDCEGTDADCGLAGNLGPSDASAVLYATTTDDRAGAAVASAGDTNGDGEPDLLIGAYHSSVTGSNQEGRAYVVLGPVADTVDLTSADAIFTGVTAFGYLGDAVAGVGDLDGDGYDDIAVGASAALGGAAGSGAVYVFLGPLAATTSASAADATLQGEAAYDYAGCDVASAGDVDGDGAPDLLIGAYNADDGGSASGQAYLVSGAVSGTSSLQSATAELAGEAGGDGAGWSVAGAGDVDGDGAPDVLVGAYGDDTGASSGGAAYLLFGPVRGAVDLSTADRKWYGVVTGDYAGEQVGGAGDVDGDGYDDVLVGAYGDDDYGLNSGAAWLLPSTASSGALTTASVAKLRGDTASDQMGRAVASLDFDADGYADLVLGQRQDDAGGSDAGSAFLWYGPVTGNQDEVDADARFSPTTASGQAGWAVATVPGTTPQMLVGAPYDSTSGALAGAVWVVGE